MRNFQKSRKIDNVSYDIRGPVLDEANRMEAEGTKILKLNIGNPSPFGFTAPEGIINEMTANLTSTEGYSNSKGIPEARQAIMEYCKFKGIPNVGMDDIFTGNGASELITMAMQGLLDPGDEVLVPAPDYPLWTASVTLAGGTAVHYICDEEADWNPDIDDIKKKITPNTKGIVIINPNNPTGTVYTKDLLEQLVQVARENGLIIFADEIYDRLVYEGETHIAVASLAPDLMTVCFNGLSKSHKLCGYRIGWMCLAGDKSHAKGYIEGLNLLSTLRLCSNVPGQSLIPYALKDAGTIDESLKPGGRIYDQGEFIYKAMNSIPGISAKKPRGAFYLFPKIDTNMYKITNDKDFALDLLRKEHVLITAGTGFNWINPDHFRIVFLPEIETLKAAAEKFEHYFNNFSL